MKRKMIYDCDNTIGIEGCDVDDGLSLLFLLACEEADLLGVTNCFGNNETERVYENTLKFVKELSRTDIKVYKGGLTPLDYESEASRYIADMARLYKGELEILATGSLTNIAGAYKYDKDFYKNVKAIYLMGGITEDLIFEKKKMDELNFSIDYNSSYEVLTNMQKVNILSGNNCLSVLFELKEYRERLKQSGDIGNYILNKTAYWFDYNEDVYGIHGFYNWDVTAACYMFYPELFEDDVREYKLSKEDLKRGYLQVSTKEDYNAVLNLPRVKDKEGFKNRVYGNWARVKL